MPLQIELHHDGNEYVRCVGARQACAYRARGDFALSADEALRLRPGEAGLVAFGARSRLRVVEPGRRRERREGERRRTRPDARSHQLPSRALLTTRSSPGASACLTFASALIGV